MHTQLLRTLAAALALAGLTATAFAQDKPAELKIGITTFTSGPAAVNTARGNVIHPSA